MTDDELIRSLTDRIAELRAGLDAANATVARLAAASTFWYMVAQGEIDAKEYADHHRRHREIIDEQEAKRDDMPEVRQIASFLPGTGRGGEKEPPGEVPGRPA